jgi:uncharacterized membrane-anchored protein
MVIDHLDLDRVTAESLVAARPAAVVNVRPTLSGRYPARGAEVLVDAGIPVVDGVGPGLLSDLHEGERLRVDSGRVYAGADRLLGQGSVLTPHSVAAGLERARAGMAGRLASVGSEAAEFVRDHEALLIEGVGLPQVQTRLSGKTVLVVAPGDRAAAEVRALRPWVKQSHALVVTADEGATAATAARLRPALVIGDPNLAEGRAVLERGDRRLHRAERLDPDAIPAGLTATELAVVLAVVGGASVVVLAGAPASFDELIDRDRAASAGLLAVRLRAGDRLVDAAAATRLRQPTVGWPTALLLLVAGLLAVVVALVAVPGGDALLDHLREALPW